MYTMYMPIADAITPQVLYKRMMQYQGTFPEKATRTLHVYNKEKHDNLHDAKRIGSLPEYCNLCITLGKLVVPFLGNVKLHTYFSLTITGKYSRL